MSSEPVPDRWAALRRHTPARIGLPRAGSAQATVAQLAFQAAHALARDAVHAALDVDALVAAMGDRPVAQVRSAAPDRATYLLRPDLGRTLSDVAPLAALPRGAPVVHVVADGLSALAVQRWAPAVLAHLPPAPLVVATQARVALGDAVGQALEAGIVVVLIGERPGLSAADSLGCYITHAPRIGRTDAERNCLSNIRDAGLAPARAARKIAWLVQAMQARRLSGVMLKDESNLLA
jgi:ethanolamine ammonia-lyase small subunit